MLAFKIERIGNIAQYIYYRRFVVTATREIVYVVFLRSLNIYEYTTKSLKYCLSINTVNQKSITFCKLEYREYNMSETIVTTGEDSAEFVRKTNPFARMRIADNDFLADVPEREPCPKCNASRKFFCYTCYVRLPELQPFPEVKVNNDLKYKKYYKIKHKYCSCPSR